MTIHCGGMIVGQESAREKIDEAGMAFFGTQGPWYTVGYTMAVVIEKREGRTALVTCVSDPRKLLASFNRDAAELAACG